MSEKIAIRLVGVGKMYKMYSSRIENLFDVFNLFWLSPTKKKLTREFWALRNVDIEVKSGTRLGIIGRNGAGKSTLLKLITQNKEPTEGILQVNGQVQALLEAGAGFHPEFTGYENIRASLIYQGLQPKEIESAILDIADFTELGAFLEQPFKTYSAGMQARLTFATATVLHPDILIVDEILGAGDAYFAGKSLERMKKLVEESGATVLIVSHALDQVLRYCEECVWIERGKIVMRGSSLEVIKAYEKFIHELEDRRIKSKNYKRAQGGYDATQLELYSDAIQVVFTLQGQPGETSDIAEVQLLKDGQPEDTLQIGDVQDTNWSQTSVVSLNGSLWSNPRQAEKIFYRSLVVERHPNEAQGTVLFYSYVLFDTAEYALKVRYRYSSAPGTFSMTILKNNDVLLATIPLPKTGPKWETWVSPVFSVSNTPDEIANPITVKTDGPDKVKTQSSTTSHWPGEGSILIESVRLSSSDDQEKVIFQPGDTLRLIITARAATQGIYEIIPNAVFYSMNGIRITCHIGDAVRLDLKANDKKNFILSLPNLNLGNGDYVISVALYKQLDPHGIVEIYDLVDRSYEFKVIGNRPYTGFFEHPSQWNMQDLK